MTGKPVADEREIDPTGTAAKRLWELYGRIKKGVGKGLLGTEQVEKTLDALQETIEGLFTRFEALVNYDDPAHRRLDRREYYSIPGDLTSEHFPISRRGMAEVEFVLLEFNDDLSDQKISDEIARRGSRDPDFAETQTFHREYPFARKKGVVIVSRCGSVVNRGGRRSAAHVVAHPYGLSLEWYQFDYSLGQHCRVLAVRK